MNAKRMFYVLTACLIILSAAGIGSIILGEKVLEQSAGRLNDLRLQTNVTDEQQNSLAKAKRDIEKYEELEKIARTIVPQEKDQVRTVREIVLFAEQSGVPITSITFPNSDLGDQGATTNNKPSNKKSSSNKSTTPSVTQVTPVQDLKGVYQLEIVIRNDKDNPTRYPALIDFLSKLEQNRRTSQVSSVSLEPNEENRNLLVYSMTINVYIKP